MTFGVLDLFIDWEEGDSIYGGVMQLGLAKWADTPVRALFCFTVILV